MRRRQKRSKGGLWELGKLRWSKHPRADVIESADDFRSERLAKAGERTGRSGMVLRTAEMTEHSSTSQVAATL
jgi:hypothetical protein